MAKHTTQPAKGNTLQFRGPANPPPQNGGGEKKGPAFEAWVVKDRGEAQKAWWTKVGAAWQNRDGSYSVELDALPLDGRIQLRVPLPPRDDNGNS